MFNGSYRHVRYAHCQWVDQNVPAGAEERNPEADDDQNDEPDDGPQEVGHGLLWWKFGVVRKL